MGRIDGNAAVERVLMQWEIEQFLYHEADLLDARRFDEWLDLFAEDVHYWMPLRFNLDRRDEGKDTSAPNELSLFDDDKPFMAARVRRLKTGRAWAEDPPSRTRHLVTNVKIQVASPDFSVRSNFLVYRNRMEGEVDLYAGSRDDILRRTADGLKIARRTILLDQNVLLSKNLSIFF
jgi:biphenyl 2,3-dioxygenase beta subunit